MENTTDIYKKIHVSQIPSMLSVEGKFYAFDETNDDTPWVGIINDPDGGTRFEKFAAKHEMLAWLGSDGVLRAKVRGTFNDAFTPATWLGNSPEKPDSFDEHLTNLVPELAETLSRPVTALEINGIPAEYAERVDSLLKINPVDAAQEELIRKNFAHYFRDLAKLTTESRAIVVTDRTDKAGMAAARDKRLQFKNVRIAAEKVRKSLKEESIRYGRVVDGSYKLIGEPCAAEEEYLQAQEDFEKNLIAAERERVTAERSAELAPFVDETRNFNLGDMSEEQFQLVLIGSRTTHEQKLKFLAEQAESDRLDRERQQRKIDRLNILSAIGLSFDGIRYAYGDIGLSETAVDAYADDEFDAKVDEINQLVTARKTERQAEIEADQAERARLQKIADDQAKTTADAAADAERRRLAPDKDKLTEFASELRAYGWPVVESESAKSVLTTFKNAWGFALDCFERDINEL